MKLSPREIKEKTHKQSDLDFGILFDPPIKTYYRLGEIANDLSDLKLPAEPDVRNISLKESPTYLMNVIQGKVLYSKDEGRRIGFEVIVMNTYRDTEYLRKLSYQYMSKRLKEGKYGFREKFVI